MRDDLWPDSIKEIPFSINERQLHELAKCLSLPTRDTLKRKRLKDAIEGIGFSYTASHKSDVRLVSLATETKSLTALDEAARSARKCFYRIAKMEPLLSRMRSALVAQQDPSLEDSGEFDTCEALEALVRGDYEPSPEAESYRFLEAWDLAGQELNRIRTALDSLVELTRKVGKELRRSGPAYNVNLNLGTIREIGKVGAQPKDADQLAIDELMALFQELTGQRPTQTRDKREAAVPKKFLDFACRAFSIIAPTRKRAFSASAIKKKMSKARRK